MRTILTCANRDTQKHTLNRFRRYVASFLVPKPKSRILKVPFWQNPKMGDFGQLCRDT